MLTAEAVIDLQALQHNYQVLKRLCPKQQLVAVIKGDAYGHGSVNVAKALPSADMFAVARIEEALELRAAGIITPILLLEGCFCSEDLMLAAEHQFHTVIHSDFQLQQFTAAHLLRPLHVWVKLDTGMHRVGIERPQFNDFVQQLQGCVNLAGELGFISHLSCADDLDSATTRQQIALFEDLTKDYSGPKTLANSAGALYWPDAQYDYVRAGISLYGIAPNEQQIGQQHQLKPVMSLKSKLISVRHHRKGEPIGYGEIWRATEDTLIGVVAMGYGDGYPRSAPAGTPVYINGRIVPIVGRVSMDMLTVDLGADAGDQVGDSVEFWGRQLPIETVAQAIDTIPYELCIKLTKRVVKSKAFT
ncbi:MULTISPECIES: alanine racemase [unclassified Agarivorans]|uniref:alanine racemase n=1 Tax=unclassified Agarivorans TaxID=2636026 RepID=UPI003D7DAAB4